MTSNSDKIILDLCGGTGSWSKPYALSGYDVRLITLPDYDVRQTQFGTDGHIYFYSPEAKGTMDGIDLAKVYGILAAPPCTQFSNARQNAKTPRDYDGAMEIVVACFKIIWACRATNNLKFWALENPVGHLRQFLGVPHFTFQPWWYGDKHTKRTDLWGYFNEPKKKRGAKKPAIYKWENVKARDGMDRATVRAITPAKFATAFFKANQ